jgi:hypothetical protein
LVENMGEIEEIRSLNINWGQIKNI